MSDSPLTFESHQATGNPGVVHMAGELAKETVTECEMTAVDVTALTMVHILAVELAAALKRIDTLERELGQHTHRMHQGSAMKTGGPIT